MWLVSTRGLNDGRKATVGLNRLIGELLKNPFDVSAGFPLTFLRLLRISLKGDPVQLSGKLIKDFSISINSGLFVLLPMADIIFGLLWYWPVTEEGVEEFFLEGNTEFGFED